MQARHVIANQGAPAELVRSSEMLDTLERGLQ